MNNDFYTEDQLMGMSAEAIGDILKHYGVKRRSGRYPWGSGLNPYQHGSGGFGAARRAAKAKGWTDEEIRKALKMTTTEYRKEITLAKEEETRDRIKTAQSMKKQGKTNTEIANQLGVSQTMVAKYLDKQSNPNSANKKRQTDAVAKELSALVDEHGIIDIGKGVERQVGISREKMKATVAQLEAQGYEKKQIFIPHIEDPYSGNGTRMEVLVKKGTDTKDIYKNLDKVRSVDFVAVGGDTMNIQNMQKPKSVSWDRISIKYAIPEGKKGHGTDADGEMADGTMLIRRGTKDLDMGNNKYAQVRIAVGGTHYLKGMALYGDDKDFPPGVDIVFNTNKKKGTPKEDVLKPLKEKLDGYNPFGATIKGQNKQLGADGKPVVDKDAMKAKAKKLGIDIKDVAPIYKNGAVNLVNEQGDWAKWDKTLSSQFLSKQRPATVKEMLGKTLKKADAEYAEIMKVQNPTIRKKLLESYASDLESKQVHLKAMAPKGFAGHVLLPVSGMKENEVYAPNYKNGDKVILVRYPHGGTFEIPELTVNNRSMAGKKKVGSDSIDAIGINPKVASKLSGADFDGDTAYVIPNNSRKFTSRNSLKELKGFDPKQYQDKPGTFKKMKSGQQSNTEMGKISNLITDMTMRGASDQELARAVKHSMVVIDAAKHKLNYKRSAEENGIDALKRKYQKGFEQIDYKALERYNPVTRKVEKAIDPNEYVKGKQRTGAGTIISRHKNTVTVGGQFVEITEKKPTKANPDREVTRTVIRKKREAYLLNMVDDAKIFLNKNSDVREKYYAEYVNDLKVKYKNVRKEINNIKPAKKDPKAALIYAEEVKSLEKKYNEAMLNKPKERQARLLAQKNYENAVKARGGENTLSKDDQKKLRQQALTGARNAVGAKRTPVKITDAEWDAIQANAISPTRLLNLTSSFDDKTLREMATPRSNVKMTGTKVSRAKAMAANGYTIAEIAQAMGVSTSTISKTINE